MSYAKATSMLAFKTEGTWKLLEHKQRRRTEPTLTTRSLSGHAPGTLEGAWGPTALAQRNHLKLQYEEFHARDPWTT